MPIYENACSHLPCEKYSEPFEWWASSSTKPNPACSACSRPTVRLISTFAVCWSSPLSKYNDKNAQQKASDSHVAWKIHSTTRDDGKPERVVIDSIQKQREYCKAEGLRLPSDINPNASVSSDGKKLYTNGQRGQWV